MIGTVTRAERERRLGRAASVVEERRPEVLAFTYGLGATGVLCAWVADPAEITNAYVVAGAVALAIAGSLAALALRRRLPPYSADAAVVLSLGLISLVIAYLADPALLMPYYVWVGFASPLWFPTRRSLTYLALTALACGADVAVVGTRAALAAWFVTMAVVLLGFVAVHFLTRLLVRHERLAAVGEMASAVGHELRNPLGTVTNSLYLARIALGPAIDPEVDRQLSVAERQIARAVTITDDLRAFVRPRRPAPTRFDLAAVVAEVLESAVAPEGIAVQLDLAPARVVADRGHLIEIVTNLVENAYQAMGDGGTLRVVTAEERGRVVLSVADSGTGMDEAVLSRVFEPFFTTRAQGTGLGLAIVRRLVEEQGGSVAVASLRGRGSRFTVRMPIGPPMAGAATREAPGRT